MARRNPGRPLRHAATINPFAAITAAISHELATPISFGGHHNG